MLRGFAQSIKDGLTSIESIFHGEEQHDNEADIPEGDNTGPVEDEQTKTVPADESQVSGPQTTDQTDADSLDVQKGKLIDKLCSQLSKLHPGDSIEAQAARLKTLKYIFGKVQLDEIAKLPVQILEAGLGAMKSQAAATETEDIPV